jgi:predicted ATP-dependent serine protease
MKLLDTGSSIARGTNINSIVVPPELRVKHATGLPWVDALLGGGFTPSIAGMLTGDSGVGKSTMIRTIADALTLQGHTVLYNCLEESEYQVKMACERLELDAGFIIAHDLFVADVIAHARELQKKCKKGKKVFLFVDSLQCLDDGKYDTGKTTKQTPINCAKELIKWAKDTFGVLVWVHQVTKGGVFVGDNTVKHAVDLHLHFGFDKDKKSPTFGERILRKDKDRFGPAIDPQCIEMVDGGRLAVKVIEESEEDKDEDDMDEAAE